MYSHSHSRSYPSHSTSTLTATSPPSNNGNNNTTNTAATSGNSYYSHSTSTFQHPGNRTPSSHLHVLQNPLQTTSSSTTNLASTPYSINSAPSPSSRISLSNYQSYGSTAHGGGGGAAGGGNTGGQSKDWNDASLLEHDGTTGEAHHQSSSHHQMPSRSSINHLNPSPRTIVSHGSSMPTPPGRPRSIITSNRHDSNATHSNRSATGRSAIENVRSTNYNYGNQRESSSSQQPNWGLFGRQLSQIAGDVSTSVRQNEILISLMERLVYRIESATLAGLLQQTDDIHKSSTSLASESIPKSSNLISRPPGISNRSRHSTGFLVLDPAPVHYPPPHHHHHHQSNSREADVRQQPPPPFVSLQPQINNTHVQAHNDATPHHAVHQTETVSSYLDDDMGALDFMGPPSRSHYSTSQTRLESGATPKRSTNDLSTPSHHSNLNATTSSSSYASQQQQHHQAVSHPHITHIRHPQGKQSTVDPSTADIRNHEASYSIIPSPVFGNAAPADGVGGGGPSASSIEFSHFYSADDLPSRSHDESIMEQSTSMNNNHTNHREQHSSTLHSPVQVRSRDESRSRLGTSHGIGMGSLEDAGIVPASALSSLNATPALPRTSSGRMEYDDREISLALGGGGDDSGMIGDGGGGDGGGGGGSGANMIHSFMDDDKDEPANDDWKLWLEPRKSNRRDLPKAKYRSAKQVKIDRKEKTKRSLSTIGRIPLKEYLEVGNDYKLVRRVARSVYNTWLALNVRLAKQDPDRLMACYHKLEYDFPILADCEDHWKAKELMLQVIDNAIDEIAFHRRKEERRLRQSGGSGENDAPEEEPAPPRQSSSTTNNRRDASTAELHTSAETGRSTRRRKGANPPPPPQPAVEEIEEEADDDVTNEFIDTHYEPSGILTRSAMNNQQQNTQQEKEDWTATGEEANMFAQSDSFQHQSNGNGNGNATSRAAAGRAAAQQQQQQVTTPGMSAVW